MHTHITTTHCASCPFPEATLTKQGTQLQTYVHSPTLPPHTPSILPSHQGHPSLHTLGRGLLSPCPFCAVGERSPPRGSSSHRVMRPGKKAEKKRLEEPVCLSALPLPGSTSGFCAAEVRRWGSLTVPTFCQERKACTAQPGLSSPESRWARGGWSGMTIHDFWQVA